MRPTAISTRLMWPSLPKRLNTPGLDVRDIYNYLYNIVLPMYYKIHAHTKFLNKASVFHLYVYIII